MQSKVPLALHQQIHFGLNIFSNSRELSLIHNLNYDILVRLKQILKGKNFNKRSSFHA